LERNGRADKVHFDTSILTKSSYRNIVTGRIQAKRPVVCKAGLLGDDMGLGKKLTILALIATSLDALRSEFNLGDSSLQQRQRRKSSKSACTLIVTKKSSEASSFSDERVGLSTDEHSA
jgi:hypothetical protein